MSYGFEALDFFGQIFVGRVWQYICLLILGKQFSIMAVFSIVFSSEKLTSVVINLFVSFLALFWHYVVPQKKIVVI
jgi:hypothetical protein